MKTITARKIFKSYEEAINYFFPFIVKEKEEERKNKRTMKEIAEDILNKK